MAIHKACAAKLKYQLRINQPKKPKKPRANKRDTVLHNMTNLGVGLFYA